MGEQNIEQLAARMWNADEADLCLAAETTEGHPICATDGSTGEGNPVCAAEDGMQELDDVGDSDCSTEEADPTAQATYSTTEGVIDTESVRSFEQLSGWEAVFGHMEKDLKSGWEVKDDVYRDTMYTGAKSIACAVSDPSAPDCPLVYISAGFESLTQYPRTFALGRNCRFLQPQPRAKNLEYNGDEIRRMRHFCEQKTGQMITLLYNEAKDGSHFWNLLFMSHIKCKGIYHSNARHYIFAVQTNIVVQKDLINKFAYDSWPDGGKENLASLRERFKAEEYKYSPKDTSLKKLADNTISQWIYEIGQSESSFWEGAHFVPVVGKPAVHEFYGVWPSLLGQAVHGIKALFDISENTAENLKTNSDPAVVCAVADPSYFDCPLVFLSVGFEDMTGYRNEFALGRNCRFLQPNVGDLNRKINSDELGRMKSFCQKQGPPGLKIVNLLLNERKTGERFWNLLHMEHVSVEGKPYILAVQTVLDMPMPSILKDRETSQAMIDCDTAMLTTFVDELAVFLQQFRFSLRSQHSESMVEASKYAHGSIVSFMKRHCDDFEGDHIVPRMGKKEVQSFEIDITWKVVLRRVQTLLVEIWHISEYNDEEVACAVSDPNGKDCPLVYVSQKFERMTGYPREWVLGRNCRFLQPNDSKRNMDFNEEDKLRMREFCSKPQPEGTRLMNLLINEDRSGYPFWNILVMEHVEVIEKDNPKDYIFAVQTKIDIEAARLAEIFALDRDGKSGLTRLRELLRSMETRLQKCSIKDMSDMLVRQWLSDFPPHLEMPRFRLPGGSSDDESDGVPLFGLFIRPEQPLLETIQAGMEEGVRHFALSLNGDEFVEDATHVEQVGRLFSFRLAELFHAMRLKHLHYLRAAMAFSLITRPQYVNSFKGVSKALSASGYTMHCWLLDVRTINPDRPMSKAEGAKVQQCWTTMAAAHKAGDVKAIGLYGPIGSIMPAMESLKKVCNLHSVSVLAVDEYPGKEQDPSRFEKFRKHYVGEYGSPCLLTYNLFGPNDSLLKSQPLQDCTKQWGMNAATALLKWAESQRYGAFVSTVRDDGLQFNKQDLPDFHRTFARGYQGAPPAHFCSVGLKGFFDGAGKQKKIEMIANTQCSQIRAEMTMHNSTAPAARRSSSSVPAGLPTIQSERRRSCVEQTVTKSTGSVHPLRRASTGSVHPRRQESLKGCAPRSSLLDHSNKEQLLAAREQLLADFKRGDIGQKKSSKFASHSGVIYSHADGIIHRDGHQLVRKVREDSTGGLSVSDDEQGTPCQPRSNTIDFKAFVDEQKQSRQSSRRGSKAEDDEKTPGSRRNSKAEHEKRTDKKRKTSNLVLSDNASSDPVVRSESKRKTTNLVLSNNASSDPVVCSESKRKTTNLVLSDNASSDPVVCSESKRKTTNLVLSNNASSDPVAPSESKRKTSNLVLPDNASSDPVARSELKCKTSNLVLPDNASSDPVARSESSDRTGFKPSASDNPGSATERGSVSGRSRRRSGRPITEKACSFKAFEASDDMPSEASNKQTKVEHVEPVSPPGKKPEGRRPFPAGSRASNKLQSDGEGSTVSKHLPHDKPRTASEHLQSDGEVSRTVSKYLPHDEPRSSQTEETLLGA